MTIFIFVQHISDAYACRYHCQIACWSLKALGVPDMQSFEQHHLDCFIRLIPTTAKSPISFQQRCAIRLLEQVNMATIQRGAFCRECNGSLQLYETCASGRVFDYQPTK